MSQWQGKSEANTLGYKIFVHILRRFGLRRAYLLLRFVSLHYFLFHWKSSKPILYVYKNKLGYGFFKALWKLRENYYVFGQTIIDKVALLAKIKTDFTFNFDGRHHLDEIVRQGKGGLLLSAHVGNWEAAGQMLEHLNTSINIVMYDGEDANIKKYLDAVTGERLFKIILVKPDLSHIFQIKAALAKNEIVCMHADRFLPGNKTITTPFLGEDALFPYGPFLLSLKLNVPVVHVYAFKETNKHYHFYSSDLYYYNKSKGDTEQTVLKDYVSNLETKLKLYPEQWFNYYDFYKKDSGTVSIER